MKELLFGWIGKTEFELTMLDKIICSIEITGLIFIITFILVLIIRKDNK